MIKGKIEDGLHPKTRVEISGQLAAKKFSMLVDTGFDLDIALHHTEASNLGLKAFGVASLDYANGEKADEPICHARVLWHGKWKRTTIALSKDEEPAIGTRLMQDLVVTLNFGTNKLTIEEYAKFKSNKRR